MWAKGKITDQNNSTRAVQPKEIKNITKQGQQNGQPTAISMANDTCYHTGNASVTSWEMSEMSISYVLSRRYHASLCSMFHPGGANQPTGWSYASCHPVILSYAVFGYAHAH